MPTVPRVPFRHDKNATGSRPAGCARPSCSPSASTRLRSPASPVSPQAVSVGFAGVDAVLAGLISVDTAPPRPVRWLTPSTCSSCARWGEPADTQVNPRSEDYAPAELRNPGLRQLFTTGAWLPPHSHQLNSYTS